MHSNAHKQSDTAPESGPKTILVTDDDEDFRLQQKLRLEGAGFKVIEAASYHDAREVIRYGKFDMAIVDLMMEEPDAGFTLCQELKRALPDTPIIMVTGVANETGIEFDASTPEERAWIKADTLLAKPIRFEQLLREIHRLFQQE
ncbi:MAG: response regulator [Candidatus Hydrogenedentes bacterium]|nr:response regulator [Candidatus Hydrogenedentota bacterium]